MEFQVVSDINLDKCSDIPIIKRVAPILVIAGNIGSIDNGSYTAFIDLCRLRFEQVVIVLGDRECSGHSIQGALLTARRLCRNWNNVHILDRSHVDLTCDGKMYRFLGCTLWRRVSDVKCADVYKIKQWVTGEPITAQMMTAVHEEHISWLTEELVRSPHDAVIVTHYSPIPEQQNDDGKPVNTKMKLWVTGHTSNKNNFVFSGARFVSNPYRRNRLKYPNEVYVV